MKKLRNTTNSSAKDIQNGKGNIKDSSRRKFLQNAGATAGALLLPKSIWAGAIPAPAANASGAFPQINHKFMITPDQALQWATFKSQGGPTYAGGAGWKRYTDFIQSRMQEFGAIDLTSIDIPYDHYVVEDWPDRRTHMHGSGVEVEKLVSDGTPVAQVASYGMTSGSTPPEGLTAPMVFYDMDHPPAKEQIAGKILVVQIPKYPEPPYTNNFLDNFTLSDYEWRSPGKWHPLFTPPPTSITSSFHSRWNWSQLSHFAQVAVNAHAAGMVFVYDLSPGAALGLTERSIYTPDGKAGLGATYVNCPTLALDRVHGAKVVQDAKAGKIATLTLKARFQRDTGKGFLGYLPGSNYGTPQDEQLLLATHTDAMSLIEEDGGLGMLGIMSYFNHIPRASRPRTLIFYFDCRHFMPGAEAAWPQYDYYNMHPERLKSIVATMGMEHMGGRQTVETGTDSNAYTYSTESPENGGVITSLIDVYNNNLWLVETIAKAATDVQWPRVDVKAGAVAPGLNGGLQGQVKSPVNKGRGYHIPGLGLAGDWPGGWCQTFAQVDTEAGAHGFDQNYFVQQVAGLSQIAGELMLVKPIMIDLGWGELKSAIVKLPDSAFSGKESAAKQRQALVDQYVAAFKKVEANTYDDAKTALKTLSANVSATIATEAQTPVNKLVDNQISKLS